MLLSAAFLALAGFSAAKSHAQTVSSAEIPLVTQVTLARVLLSAPSTGGWDYFNEQFRGMTFRATEYKNYPVAKRSVQSMGGLGHVVVGAGTRQALMQVAYTIGPLRTNESPIETLLDQDAQVKRVCVSEESEQHKESYYAYERAGGTIYAQYYRGDAPGGRIESLTVGSVSLPPECARGQGR